MSRRRALLDPMGGGGNFITLTITINTGVKQIDVTVNGVKTTYTTTTTVQIPVGATVSWTATANTGYTLSASSGNLGQMTTNQTIAPTASVTTYTLTITKNTNVKSIKVTIGSNASETFTSSTTKKVEYGTKVTWSATADTGFVMDTASGTISSMTSNQTIAPTATIRTYTLTITKNSNVKSITVTIGTAAAQTFTSDATKSVNYGTEVTWSAVANNGFEMDTASGTITSMTSNQEISPIAVYPFVWDGQQTVDLGLPSGKIWQAYNLGATKPEESGLYYQWGDTKGYSGACTSSESDGNNDKHYFYWNKYKYCNGLINTMNKYCIDASYGTVDNKTVLENEDDAAYVASGGTYRMPTSSECEELVNESYVTRYRAKCNGVKGYALVSKKNGKGIFFPVLGYGSTNSIMYVGTDCLYWASSLDVSDSNDADTMHFYFSSDEINPQINNHRYYGLTIRGVVV